MSRPALRRFLPLASALPVLAALLVAGCGSGDSSTPASAKARATTKSTAVRADAPAKGGVDPADAKRFVLQFYAGYERHSGRAYVARYGTPHLVAAYDAITDFDTIICAQDFPRKYVVQSSTPSGKEAIVDVRAAYAGQDVKLVVRVVRTPKLRIDSVACPT